MGVKIVLGLKFMVILHFLLCDFQCHLGGLTWPTDGTSLESSMEGFHAPFLELAYFHSFPTDQNSVTSSHYMQREWE